LSAGAIACAREEKLATSGTSTIVPPQNLEAEESVLGAMMVSGSTIEPVLLDVRLQAEDFYRDRHRTIYQAIIRLSEDANPVDVLTVSEALAQHGQLDEVGGRDVVASLAAKVPAPGSARHYAQIVKQNSLMRRLDAAAKRIQQSVAERDGEPPRSSSRPSASSSRSPTRSARSTSARSARSSTTRSTNSRPRQRHR
jgi:replicative DNA helicase